MRAQNQKASKISMTDCRVAQDDNEAVVSRFLVDVLIKGKYGVAPSSDKGRSTLRIGIRFFVRADGRHYDSYQEPASLFAFVGLHPISSSCRRLQDLKWLRIGHHGVHAAKAENPESVESAWSCFSSASQTGQTSHPFFFLKRNNDLELRFHSMIRSAIDR